jgi:hypothetical protein
MLLLLLSMLLPAQAGSGPYMWGGGPTINTIVYPGEHPALFPGKTKDEDKKPLLDKTKGDVGIGGRGVLYLGKTQRIGAHLWYSMGGGHYKSPNFTIEYDMAGTDMSGVGLLAGLGAGLGHQRWETPGKGELKSATYILRGQGAVNYRTKRNMFELGIFLNLIIPGKQKWTPVGGETEEFNGGWPINPTIGLEANVYFGDFTPPKKKKKKKKKRRG